MTKNVKNTTDIGGHWPTPPSSCPSTPPRPRLPKHFKPTPFIPRDSPPPVLPRHFGEYTESDTSQSVPPSPPQRQRTFLSDISPSSDEGTHRFRPVIPSPKLLRRTNFRDFSSASSESLTGSQDSLTRSFHHFDVTDTAPNFTQSVKELRKKFFEDVSHRSDDNSSKSEIIVPPTKSVHSIKEQFISPAKEHESETKIPVVKKLKTKIPPPISPKPVRRKLTEKNNDTSRDVKHSIPSQSHVQSAFIQVQVHGKDDALMNGIITTNATGNSFPKPSKAVSQENIHKTDDAVSDKGKISQKFLRRRKFFDYSSDHDEGTRKSRSVPASPRLTLRQFWRDYSPSSDGGSEVVPLKKSPKSKKSKGLSLFSRMRRKLLDMGIPGIWCGLSMDYHLHYFISVCSHWKCCYSLRECRFGDLRH